MRSTIKVMFVVVAACVALIASVFTAFATILINGDWQMRQSEGNRTENKPSAADLSAL